MGKYDWNRLDEMGVERRHRLIRHYTRNAPQSCLVTFEGGQNGPSLEEIEDDYQMLKLAHNIVKWGYLIGCGAVLLRVGKIGFKLVKGGVTLKRKLSNSRH